MRLSGNGKGPGGETCVFCKYIFSTDSEGLLFYIDSKSTVSQNSVGFRMLFQCVQFFDVFRFIPPG